MTKKDMFDKLYEMYKEELNDFFRFSQYAEDNARNKIYERASDKAFQKAQILEKAIEELFGIDAYSLYFED